MPQTPPIPPSLPSVPPPAGRKKKVSGCFIGCLALVAAFFILPALIIPNFLRHREARMKALQQPVQIEVEAYEPLIGEELSGSGFHFESGGQRFIGCSLHQFEGKQPKEMMMLETDGEVKITERVHKGEDIQILRYESPQLDKLKPLKYRPDVTLSEGHPVLLYAGGEPVVGHVTRVKSGLDGLAHFATETPFAAMGCSGSPVVSGITGTVVGIALTANDPEKATDVGFEILRLPSASAP